MGWDGIYVSLTPPTTRAPLAVLIIDKTVPKQVSFFWLTIVLVNFLFKHHYLRSLEDAEERYEDQYDSHGVLIKDQVMTRREEILQNCS